MKTALAAALLAVFPVSALAQDKPPVAGVTLTAFECGRLKQEDLGWFSDTFRFRGEKKELIAGCFLIRHPKGNLLWDTGLTPELIGAPPEAAPGMSLKTRISERLAVLGLSTHKIDYVGISHHHGDHSGGADEFPNAELLIGAADAELLKGRKDDDRDKRQLRHWIPGGPGKMRAVEGDLDLFEDGSVIMLAMPGHTPGHSALLVRLPRSGYVLISGDQYHFRENRAVAGVPTFNANRADTLASHARFEEIAKNLKARVIIQHDERDMASLPAFPEALD